MRLPSVRLRPAVLAVSAAALSLTAPALAAATHSPAATRAVSYDGVRLRVPRSWPVVNLARHPRACPRLDVHAVYLGSPGPDPRCPADLAGKTTAVMIEPVATRSPDLRQDTRRITIGGRAARTNTDAAVTHTMTDVLPSAGVQVTLSYGASPAPARRIQSTIIVTSHARAMTSVRPAAIQHSTPQQVVKGSGFDTCAAPSLATMRSWLASPYRSVGVYIGGVNRACAQASLTSAWLSSIQQLGWHYFPIYVGLQASCVSAFGDATINSADAAAEGRAAASDAVTQAKDLGIPAGTPIIFDMEGYAGSCGSEVIRFLSAWDAGLQARGYLAGIYESFSNISDLVSAKGQMTEPDVMYYARWDGDATTTSSYMPAGMWTGSHRIHQFSGGHTESFGGVTVDIDSDQLDVALGGDGGTGGGGTGPAAGSHTRPAFRPAVAINSNGSAEWFARALSDTVRHNYQHPVNSTSWSRTRAVGDSPSDLAGNPAVSSDQNGSLTLFSRTAAGQIVHAWQQTGAPNGWQWSGQVGRGAPPGGATRDPAAIRVPGGKVTVFVTQTDGSVALTRQDAANDNTGWTAWASLGGSCASTPDPIETSDDAIELFCTTSSGGLAVDTMAAGGTTWSGWQTIAGEPGALSGTPSAVRVSSGETEVFARLKSGRLGYAWQTGLSGAWTWGSSPAGTARMRRSPSAVAWPGGGAAVFSQARDGRLGYVVQDGAGDAGWGTWTQLATRVLGSPVAWINADGHPEVAVLDKPLEIAVSTLTGSTWSSYKRLGGGF